MKGRQVRRPTDGNQTYLPKVYGTQKDKVKGDEKEDGQGKKREDGIR